MKKGRKEKKNNNESIKICKERNNQGRINLRRNFQKLKWKKMKGKIRKRKT